MLLGDKVIPSKNYRSLLSDDGEDIVFCGENTNGETIVGSIVEDDGENKRMIYYHLIISKEDLNLFIDKKITYLDIFEKYRKIYIVKKSYSNLRPQCFINIVESSLEDLEPGTLPLKNSYI
jgi:hypothetical protein